MTILQEPITDPIVVQNYVGGEWLRSAGEYHDIMDPARQRDHRPRAQPPRTTR